MAEMKIKVLHIGCLVNPGIGIINQLTWEQMAAKNNNFNIETFLFTTHKYSKYSVCKTSKESNLQLITYLKIRVKYFYWLLKNKSNYDVILLRYSPHDPFQFLISFFVKNYYTIHHTFENEEILISKNLSKIKLFFEKYFSKKILANSKGIIGVTNEICNYQIQRLGSNKNIFVYPNGIYSDFTAKSLQTNEINCIFVSSQFQKWTGIDHLINDYTLNGNLGMRIHLIGKINEKLRKELEKSTLFIVHGELNPEDIHKIYDISTIAISSFGFDRKNMKEACPLKSTEYLSAGLPVVGGYNDAVLPINFPYYTKMNPSLFEIKHAAIKSLSYSRLEVKQAAMPYIDKANLLKLLMNFLSTKSNI